MKDKELRRMLRRLLHSDDNTLSHLQATIWLVNPVGGIEQVRLLLDVLDAVKGKVKKVDGSPRSDSRESYT